MKLNRFAKFAWGVLVYNIIVILWGAYVRATGSGAGCGSHWPLCNGEVLPRAPQIATLVEFTHRVSSGVSFVLVLVLFLWALRRYTKDHVVRLGTGLSMIFIVTEASIGAGLVIFEWVASDASAGRAVAIAVHLINTFLLLASLTLTAWWASGGLPIRTKGQGGVLWGLGLGFAGLLLLGVSGAITALGDTLFPAGSLLQGMQQDFSPSAHFLIRLRVWHPVAAIIVSFYLILVTGVLGLLRSNLFIKRFALALIILILIQLAIGVTNLLLLAPIWVQIVHLLLADLVWITLVLVAAITLAIEEVPVESVDERRRLLYSGSRSAT